MTQQQLLNGNEAVARAAYELGCFGIGYPGTPSTEILEVLGEIGGRAQWSPNEKVAFEVALGAAFGGGRALVTMKHVGLNVAADPFFSAAPVRFSGALVVVVADDPSMHSSQNEQDSRRLAVAAGVPVLEPADAQQAYNFFYWASQLSGDKHRLVMLRLTTRVCHTRSPVETDKHPEYRQPRSVGFKPDPRHQVMLPSNARPAHAEQHSFLDLLAEEAEGFQINWQTSDDGGLYPVSVITAGVASLHVFETDPNVHALVLGMTNPLPLRKIRNFCAAAHHRGHRIIVLEEGDSAIHDACRAAGIDVEDKPRRFHFGELTSDRVRRILSGDRLNEPETAPPRGLPPRLCQACPHRATFKVLKQMGLKVAGDIGCYTLGALPPFEAMHTCVCMGASIGVGLGLRHVLPESEATRVVSVIGDSTFVHSGLTGLVEALYTPPPTGHVILILDNGTTAMTGVQENPATGLRLDGRTPTHQLDLERVVLGLGLNPDNLAVVHPMGHMKGLRQKLREFLDKRQICVLIVRDPCEHLTRKRERGQKEA